MTKYEAVRAKVMEACPDAVEVVEWKDNEPYIVKDSPLRISHVLRAIGKPYAISAMGHFLECSNYGEYINTLTVWDLSSDDLSLQPPETIDFLFNILCE